MLYLINKWKAGNTDTGTENDHTKQERGNGHPPEGVERKFHDDIHGHEHSFVNQLKKKWSTAHQEQQSPVQLSVVNRALEQVNYSNSHSQHHYREPHTVPTATASISQATQPRYAPFEPQQPTSSGLTSARTVEM